MALLEVDDLRVTYPTPAGPVRAVDGITFSLEGPGEAVGIIGESGSGKTSLALALMRLLPRNAEVGSGGLRFRGRDLPALSDEDFRREVRWKGMAMVFQGAMHALNPVISVGDQVAERLLADGMPRPAAQARVADLMGRVGLPATIGRRYPHELSGGMKQRVMIAMALTHDPPLLILDEPTSALDVSVQAQVMNLLKELRAERGISMLFITHDLALASDLCDRVVVVYAGQIREHGSADDVLVTPRDPYTRGLLGSIARLHGEERPTFLPGAPPDLRELPAGCRFAPRCPSAFERCGLEPPPLREVAPGRWARCWLYERAPGDPRVAESGGSDAGPGAAGAGAAGSGQGVPGSGASARVPGASARVAGASAPGSGASVPVSGEVGPLLRVEHVKVHFEARQGFFHSLPVRVLEDVSLTLDRGETLAVVGESGSGKTTLGRATLRLVPLAAGRVVFDGTDITDLDERRLKAFRRRAQAIFQDSFSSLSPFMRVFDLVEEPLVIHGPASRAEREALVLRVLELVRLEPAREVATKYPHTLSGGQRQRVSIARAMVLEPTYIVADEPVSMIDASSRAEILSLLRGFQETRGLSFLYITHDLASARHFADRIAVLYLGRIVELAGAHRLIDEPLHPYSRALLAAVPEPDPANRLRSRPVVAGEPPSALAVPTGCPFHPRCPVAIKGTCETIEPPLVELSPGHQVACHLYPAAHSAAPQA